MRYRTLAVLFTISLVGCATEKTVEHEKTVKYIDNGYTTLAEAEAQTLKAKSVRPTFENGYTAFRQREFVLSWLIFLKLAEQGDARAQAIVGLHYLYGRGSDQKLDKGIQWLRKGAEQDDARAEFFLGQIYAGRFFKRGGPVQKDSVEAFKWYRLAAEQNYAEAEFNVGYAYALGEGVAKNTDEAARWYERSAEHGSPNGQLQTAFMYRTGRWGKLDRGKSLKWYREAATWGFPIAYYQLARFYDLDPTRWDPKEAYIWYSLAIRKPPSWVAPLRDLDQIQLSAYQARERVRKQLSPAQLEEAEAEIPMRGKILHKDVLLYWIES